MGKKIFLLGFIIVLLIAIPATIYLVSQQLKTKTVAVPATSLNITPNSESASVGQDINLDVNVNPDTNAIAYVKLVILYDATKLATTGAGFVPNTSAFPLIINGPTFEPGTISVTVSVNANTPPITKSTQVGTLNFKTLDITENVPTQISFGDQTQTLANGQSSQTNENLLATTIPANININNSLNTSQTLMPTPTSTVEIPTPTQTSIQNLSGSEIPTPTTTAQIPSSVQTPTPTTTVDLALASLPPPVCLSFTADRPTSNIIAPFNVNFTLIGTSSALVSKATFNFGDGQSQDITAASGALSGTSVNSLAMHVYTLPGSYNATGTITDVNGKVSSVTNCTIAVSTNSASGSATPIPSLAPSGPGNLINLAIIGLLISVIGVFLLMAL
jgi:hypothetical protein